MGQVIIFSAPSGSGKTTLVRHALREFPQLEFSISCTTRNPRPGETNAVDYYFITAQEFRNKIENQEFVEYEEVYTDNFYGTLKSEVQRIWQKGKTVIFDVDVKGGIALKEYFKEEALSIFITVPKIEDLEQRLIDRNTDSLEVIQTRVEKAAYEMTFKNQFDQIIINEDLDRAKKEVEGLLEQFIK